MRTALRRLGRLFYFLLFIAATLNLHAAPSTTTISGVIYRADGSTASGTLLLSWPAFNTADGQAVAAGTMSLAIGQGGAISLALAPTERATPAGTSYRVIYKLDDGTTSTETWVVPAGGPTTIAAIRARVTSSNPALAWGNATQLQGKPIATTAPQNGQALIYSASASRYEPQAPGSAVPDADAITKGKLQLTGDLGGTASAPTVPGLASKANQSALDAANSAAAAHYSSTVAHSATSTPTANRIVMSGTSGKLDKGWLPSAVDPMTLGTGANGSPLSIKSPDASNFLRISAIDIGSNPGQSDLACGTMHDIFYPYGYNSIYGANYDSSKPSFEETLETNWCPGDGHAYFEWYNEFYAPWSGGAAQPFRPIFFQIRKDGTTAADYTAVENHMITSFGFVYNDQSSWLHGSRTTPLTSPLGFKVTTDRGGDPKLETPKLRLDATDGSLYTFTASAQNAASPAGSTCSNPGDTTYTKSWDGTRWYIGHYICGADSKWHADYVAPQVWSTALAATQWGNWKGMWTIEQDVVITRIDVRSLDDTQLGTCSVAPQIWVQGNGGQESARLSIPNGAYSATGSMSTAFAALPTSVNTLFLFAAPGTCTGNNKLGAVMINVTYRAL